jgi:predicted DCC family thiol-disulfide oxidoreductase YuxK
MDAPSILLFDGHCSLCNASVDFVLKRDTKKRIRFAAMQSPAGQRVLKHFDYPSTYLDSLILVEKGKVYLGSTAALRVARKLRRGWPLLYPLIILPKGIRDTIYQWIGANRYAWFGRRESCRMPTPSERERFLPLDYPL